MEEVKQIYKNILEALVAAERNYKQSKEDKDKSWMDYWHGVIDAYNRILFDLEDTFGLEE